MRHIYMLMGYHLWGAMLEYYQDMPKLTNIIPT